MYKIGDKVKCIKIPARGCYQLNERDKAIDCIYTITDVAYGISVKLKEQTGRFSLSCFIKVKPKHNEIESLDCFKNNEDHYYE